MSAIDAGRFTKLEHGPYGLRWSYDYDPDTEDPPSVEEAAAILGISLAPGTVDATAERADGRAEEVYFAAEDCDPNAIQTYQVQ